MLLKNICIIDENYNAKRNMNIIVEGSVISYIDENIPENYTGEIYDGNGKIAAPALFNIHCHSPMGLLRGYGEGLPLQSWLFDKMFPFEALLTAEDVYWGSLLGIAEMIKSGACSFTDMYFFMNDIAKAVDESGFKANLSHGTSCAGQSDAKLKDTNGYNGTVSLMKYVSSLSHDRIIADMSLHAEYTCGDTLCREAADFAKENNLRMHIHLSETKKEHDEAKTRRKMTATQWFKSHGVFDVPTTAAHCVWIEDSDMDILAKNKVTVAHCPSSNLKLGSGIAPIKSMIQHGINVGIGTDGAASNNNLNVLEEVNLAAIVQKGVNHDPLFLSTSDVFKLACKNGAASQGRANCGAIKVGNRADIVVFDTKSSNMLPVIDPASNILYSAQDSNIVMNMVDGKVLYKNGEFTTIDIEKVYYHAEKIVAQKLKALNHK